MSMLVSARTWFRRQLAAVPFAWHYDPVFRWATIGAAIAIAVFLLRLSEPPAPHSQTPAPASFVLTEPGSAYGTSAAGAPPAPVMVPKIAPGRSLAGMTVTPAPEDQFGTAPPANHK